MINKNSKTEQIRNLCLLIICLLIITNTLTFFSTKNQLRDNPTQISKGVYAQTIFTWTTTEVVSTESTEWSRRSSLVVDDGGNIHIAWEDDTDYTGCGTDTDIFYKRWNVTTSMWTTTEVVSTESTGWYSRRPSLVVDIEGNVHIAWHDDTNYAGCGTDDDIFYKRWNITTSMWTTTEVVSTESTSRSNGPSLGIDTKANIHIAWND